jgi:uncharacterized protein (DUF305 family)
MTMGCGDLRCNSSKLFMRENMLMHKGMAIKFSCNPDVDFVRGMIPHHAGALKMCAVLRQTTPSATLEPFLAYLCNHIEQGQSREITQMTSWLANRSMSATTVCSGNDSLTHAGMAMGCGNGTCLSTQLFIRENMLMHKGMAIKFSCNPDVDFVRGMIPHHAGALKMCAVLRQTTPECYSGAIPGLPVQSHRARAKQRDHADDFVVGQPERVFRNCFVSTQPMPTSTSHCGSGSSDPGTSQLGRSDRRTHRLLCIAGVCRCLVTLVK